MLLLEAEGTLQMWVKIQILRWKDYSGLYRCDSLIIWILQSGKSFPDWSSEDVKEEAGEIWSERERLETHLLFPFEDGRRRLQAKKCRQPQEGRNGPLPSARKQIGPSSHSPKELSSADNLKQVPLSSLQKRTQPCQQLDFNQVRFTKDFWHTEL